MYSYLIAINTSKNDPFLREWKNNGLDTAIIFKPVNKLLRGIRRIWITCNLPFQNVWYGEIKNKVKNADVIVVHISSLTLAVCKYINKQNPNAKVIAWYWNRVYQNTKPALQKGRYEAWSFDPDDCARYDFQFNHQYYFKSMILPSKEIEWDVYFCGKDTDREDEIVKIYNYCKQMDIASKFQVVNPKSDQIPISITSKWIDYDEIRQNIAKSNAILEVLRDGQSGPTLRMMEAIFFQKKLITNNSSVKYEDFYCENRIFIYTERPIEELKSFLREDFEPYDDALIEKYDVKQWAKNFTGDKK